MGCGQRAFQEVGAIGTSFLVGSLCMAPVIERVPPLPSREMSSIRRIRPDDWLALRQLRLRALKCDPHAFGSTHEAEAAAPSDNSLLCRGRVLVGSSRSPSSMVTQLAWPGVISPKNRRMSGVFGECGWPQRPGDEVSEEP